MGPRTGSLGAKDGERGKGRQRCSGQERGQLWWPSCDLLQVPHVSEAHRSEKVKKAKQRETEEKGWGTEDGRAFRSEISKSSGSSAWHDSGQSEHGARRAHRQSCLLVSGDRPKPSWVALGTPTRNAICWESTVGSAGHTLSGCSPGHHGQASVGKVAAPVWGEVPDLGGELQGLPQPHTEGGTTGGVMALLRPKTSVPQSWGPGQPGGPAQPVWQQLWA